MYMTENEQSIRDEVGKIFPSSTIAARVVELVTSNRPAGWDRKSIAPYYKKVYADDLKVWADKQIACGKPIIYDYATWCTPETGVSPQTLYNRVYQSRRYLLERMDPDKVYDNWQERTRLERERGVGVTIRYIAGLGPTDEESDPTANLSPRLAEARSAKPVWLRKLDDWIEDESEVEPFIKEGLALRPEEVTELKVRLAGLKNVEYSISQTFVKAIKTS